jgi:hypothetical protein
MLKAILPEPQCQAKDRVKEGQDWMSVGAVLLVKKMLAGKKENYECID